MLKLLSLVSLFITAVNAYSSGAGSPACGSSNMNPSGHPSSTVSGSSPYGIELSSTQYSAGGSITVTLKGSESFMGFLILALPADDETASPIGTFVAQDPSESGLVQTRCTGGATHTSAFSSSTPLKDKIELKWNAPSPVDGNIIFYVTFVKKVNEYWVKQPSAPVWDGQSARPTTGAPSAVTDPPSLSPAVSSEGCGRTKSCYSDCEGTKCGFLVTWKKEGSKVQFEMFGSLADNQNYLALGLGDAKAMLDVSIIACTANSRRESQVEHYYAAERISPTYESVGPASSLPTEAAVNTADSPKTMSCRFTYDNEVAKGDLAKWKDLDTKVYLFVAKGAYVPQSLSKHDSTPPISDDAQQLTADGFVNVGGSSVRPLIKAHACIMVLAWVFCASVGLILARYYKPMWTDTKACGQKVWFSYHRALMLCAMFLTVIGFILIVVEKGNFDIPLELPTRAHPILGLIAIICAIINPLIAAFRCHPGDSKRPIFNWVHWFFGTVAHVFAMAAIVTGSLFVDTVVVPTWTWYVSLALPSFHVLSVIVLEVHEAVVKRRAAQPQLSSTSHLVDEGVNKDSLHSQSSKLDDTLKVVAIFLGMLFQSVILPGWITYVMMAFCLFHVCVEFILEIHQCCMYDKNRDRQDEYSMANKSGPAVEPKYAGRGFKCAMLVIYMIGVSILTIVLVAVIAAWGLAPGTTQ